MEYTKEKRKTQKRCKRNSKGGKQCSVTCLIAVVADVITQTIADADALTVLGLSY